MNLRELFSKSIDKNLANDTIVVGAPRKRVSFKPLIAAVVFVALIVSASLGVYAAVNENKTAKLNFDIAAPAGFSCVRQDDTITLTASVASLAAFRRGLYGFTLDISYDNAMFAYVEDSATSAVADFDAYSNEATLGEVTILFFADDLSYLDANSPLFTMEFEVIGNTADDYPFVPFNCKFADKAGTDLAPEDGFELIDLTIPDIGEDEGVIAVSAIKAGDVDGDTVIGLQDMILLKKHLVNANALTGGALKAAKTPETSSSALNPNDLVWMKMEMLGLNVVVTP